MTESDEEATTSDEVQYSHLFLFNNLNLIGVSL